MREHGDFIQFNIRGMDSQGKPLVLHCVPNVTSLYIHAPQFREVDHIYHITDEYSENQTLGAMVWRHLIGEEAFDEFSEAMIKSGNWEYHYRPEPLELDMEAFASSHLKIPESIPFDFS